MTSRFREIPAVNDVLRHPDISGLVDERSHESVVEIVREELNEARATVIAGGHPSPAGRRRAVGRRKSRRQVESAGPKP